MARKRLKDRERAKLYVWNNYTSVTLTRIFSLGSLAWDLWLGIFGLRSLPWDLWLGISGSGSLAWDLWLGISGLSSRAGEPRL